MNAELSITLSDKQKEIYKDCMGEIYDYIVVNCGRQVGKSTIGQLISFMWATNRTYIKVGFFMPTYKQCKNIFKRMKMMLQDMMSEGLVTFVAQPDFCITFYNGSTIQFFTADNENFRGNKFDYLIVDEACFIEDDIWSALLPTIGVSLSDKTNKGKVLLLSTPSKKNWFYRLTKNKQKNVKNHKFTSEEGGIMSKEVIADVKANIADCIFRREYMAEFLESGAALFRYIPCINDNPKDLKGVTAGLDIASKGDYTVLTIFNRNAEMICIERFTDQSYDIILKSVIKLLKKYGSPMVYIETNGVGQMPYEFLKREYGRTKEWHTSQTSKHDIIQKLIIDFNTKEITILDNEVLKDELDNFSVTWVNGNPKYEGNNRTHDDCCMSLAIANFHRPVISKQKAINFKRPNRKLM